MYVTGVTNLLFIWWPRAIEEGPGRKPRSIWACFTLILEGRATGSGQLRGCHESRPLRRDFRRNVLLQERSDAIRFVDDVFQAREAVSFILVDLYLHIPAIGLNALRDLNGLGRRISRIIAAGDEQKRGLDVAYEIDRRPIFPKRTVLFRVAHEESVVFTQACIFILEFSE